MSSIQNFKKFASSSSSALVSSSFFDDGVFENSSEEDSEVDKSHHGKHNKCNSLQKEHASNLLNQMKLKIVNEQGLEISDMILVKKSWAFYEGSEYHEMSTKDSKIIMEELKKGNDAAVISNGQRQVSISKDGWTGIQLGIANQNRVLSKKLVLTLHESKDLFSLFNTSSDVSRQYLILYKEKEKLKKIEIPMPNNNSSTTTNEDCIICLYPLDTQCVQLPCKCSASKFHPECLIELPMRRCTGCQQPFGTIKGSQVDGSLTITKHLDRNIPSNASTTDDDEDDTGEIYSPIDNHINSKRKHHKTVSKNHKQPHKKSRHTRDMIIGYWKLDFTFPKGSLKNKNYASSSNSSNLANIDNVVHYTSAYYTAYIPATKEGTELLMLMILSFYHRMCFFFDTTTNIIRYSSAIHYKTAIDGGFSNHAYPDDDYVSRHIKIISDLLPRNKFITLAQEYDNIKSLILE